MHGHCSWREAGRVQIHDTQSWSVLSALCHSQRPLLIDAGGAVEAPATKGRSKSVGSIPHAHAKVGQPGWAAQQVLLWCRLILEGLRWRNGFRCWIAWTPFHKRSKGKHLDCLPLPTQADNRTRT